MLRKIFLPLAKSHVELNKKWWHRLFVVIYVILIVLFLLIAIAVSSDTIPEKLFNIKINNNLRDFTKEKSRSTLNTIPGFLNQKGKFGCLKNNTAEFLSTYTLETKSMCNADFSNNIDETAKELKKVFDDTSPSLETAKKFILESLYKNNEKRYCFIHKDIECSSNKIINYNWNVYYYLQIIIYSLLSTYLFSLFLQVIYFKGLIYIIYGKK